jgi:L-fuconolactonase
MPDFPIVDSHLHVWDPRKFEYPWLSGFPFLNRPFLLNDYNQACGAVDMSAMVFLQCDVAPAQAQLEAAWVAELARDDERIKGMVPYAPLELGGAVEADLQSLSQYSILRGVRRIVKSESDLDFCLRPNFIEGVNSLQRFGLSFDLCINYRHLPNALTLVDRCPEVPFILDHVGMPGIRDGLIEPWRSQLKELGKRQHVYCKLSSLTTEADLVNWRREEIRPFIDAAVAAFGFDRLVFGADWPVSTQGITIPGWVELLDWALAGTSEEDLGKLYRDNAIRFYRLN